MRPERLKDYNSIIKLLMTERAFELKSLLSKTHVFSYNTLYKAISQWVTFGLVVSEEEKNKIPGGTKFRYRITSEGKACFQKIADITSDIGNITISKDECGRILEGVEREIEKGAAGIIKKGMNEFSSDQLKKYLKKELVSLLQDSVYDIFDKYFIVPKSFS